MIFRQLAASLRRAYTIQFAKRLTSTRLEVRPPIIQLHDAVLCYPESDNGAGPINLSIAHPSTGGHVVLGRNASGKSLLAYALVSLLDSDINSTYLRSGTYQTAEDWHKRAIAIVSFRSHEELLMRGGTVYKSISDGAILSKAAQFLVVRFGLYQHLHRQVNTLSTGEIRKVLIIRALAQRPRLLILDNAFDGLDVETRDNLKDLVSRTIQGFRPDILVQGVSAKATAHTQVLLITNRQEEIVDEIEHVTFLTKEGLVTEDRRSGQKLLEQALASTVAFNSEDSDDTSLPTLKEIRALWKSDTSSSVSDMKILAKGLNYVKGDNALIKELHWKVTKGQRWLIAGRNGAGKSSLSRLLAKSEPDNASLAGQLWLDNVECREDRRRRGVGWCSTELHLELTLGESARTVQDVFQDEGSTPQSMYTVLAWLGLDGRSIESLPYLELSQGQQKLILIGAAIACQPDTLVFDEITQGLDVFNRRRVLNLLQLVCEATDVTLIYITHHLEELELLPSITKVLHLAGGEAIFNGELDEYSADAV